jgi:hypothetical protein
MPGNVWRTFADKLQRVAFISSILSKFGHCWVGCVLLALDMAIGCKGKALSTWANNSKIRNLEFERRGIGMQGFCAPCSVYARAARRLP